MEQVGRSGESDGNQPKRMKMPENLGQPPQAPPQKCPRCDSNNTKFCYYNNYSLSQPRYFCKTCRRYWTQGGTLRNVPVGGGCRKAGKRSVKSSTSGGGGGGSSSATSESSSRSFPPLQITANLSADLFSGNDALSTVSPLYSGGGFLSSLADMQSQGNQFGGNVLLHLPTPNMAAQIQPQTGLYQMVNTEKTSMESSFYQSDHQTLFQTTQPLGSWTQRFINNNNYSWNISSASSSSGATTTAASGSTLSPNQWPHDLPGFGPTP